MPSLDIDIVSQSDNLNYTKSCSLISILVSKKEVGGSSTKASNKSKWQKHEIDLMFESSFNKI
jgi:hypothetical protein